MKTYTPNPIDTSSIMLPKDLIELTESLAKNVHDHWAEQRIMEGWVFGPERVEATKETPCLVPYEDLPESEREYDRKTAMETVKVIIKLGYDIRKSDGL